jgi:regulatory protein
MLAARARARTELRRLLLRKKEPAELVDAALERLAAAGFLDDAQFARQFARSKALGASMSRRRLGQELSRRGVDRETGDGAIDEVFEEEGVDEAALIDAAARKKLRTLVRLEADVRRRRLYAFLARRGFDASEIARVVAALVGRGDDDALDAEAVVDPEDTGDALA